MALSSQIRRRVGTGAAYRSSHRLKRRRRVRQIALAGVGVLGVLLVWSYLTPAGEPAGGDPALSPPDDAVVLAPDERDDAAPDDSPEAPSLASAAPPARMPPQRPAETAERSRRTTPATAAEPQAAETRSAPQPLLATRSADAPSDAPAAAIATPTPASESAGASASGSAGPGAPGLRSARELIEAGRPLEARRLLNEALRTAIDGDVAADIRRELTALNDRLLLSPEIVRDDPYAQAYIVQPGDALSKIAPKHDVPVDLIAHVNRLSNPNSIRAGARLKLVRGPFHAVVHKSAYRIDVYLGAAPGDGLFVRSFEVGLGEFGSTPVGRFIVRGGSKLRNPEWVNPRTGERFFADDPENPLGERWIGLRGLDENTRNLTGYGIHGTIEPETIGTQASMGCIRLRAQDIELLYAMLSEEQSRVTILP